MEKLPLVLIVNDDGIYSKGIKMLVDTLRSSAEIIVVAPDKPQSGMSHAITINGIIRLNEIAIFPGIISYTCSGTPVDCVKLAISEILNQKPDLILSGINHGENTSTNVLYSGTMGAAIEASMCLIPSIGFSLADFSFDADFSHCGPSILELVKLRLNHKIPKNVSLNVNFPPISQGVIRGIKFCKQADLHWDDAFVKRIDQYGLPYFWMSGTFDKSEATEGTDIWAVNNGFVSVVPTQFDLTDYALLNQLTT